MGRLIREEDVIREIDKWLDNVGTAYVGKGLSYYGELLGCISDAPTVDAVPVHDIEKAIDNIGVIARASNNTNFINGCTASLNELYKALTPQKVDGKKVQE